MQHLSLDNESQWNEKINLCDASDTYHRAGYHRVAQKNAEGEPLFFWFEQGDKGAGLPILRRKIGDQPWLDDCDELFDATSVYGYPGPVTNATQPDPDFAHAFQSALHHALLESRITSLFTRLNPLVPTNWLLDGFGELRMLNKTVSISLQQTDDELLAGMSSNHRRNVRKCLKQGLVSVEDKPLVYLDDFIRIYSETMQRNSASDFYFFNKDYYVGLVENLGSDFKLFAAMSAEGELVSAAIFFLCGDIIQYHLGATPNEFLKLSGLKLLFYEVAKWGRDQGFKHLHLGGGFGGSDEDSLFKFKSGFSQTTHNFSIFSHIVDQERYASLASLRDDWIKSHGKDARTGDFFPKYRQPV